MARSNRKHGIKRHGYLVSLLYGLTLETKFGRHRGEIKKGRIEVLLNYQSRHLLKRTYTMQYILLQPSTYFPVHAFSRFHWILKYK